MFNKIILILICLILLQSCGKKNEPKYQASFNNNVMHSNKINNIFKMPELNEIR